MTPEEAAEVHHDVSMELSCLKQDCDRLRALNAEMLEELKGVVRQMHLLAHHPDEHWETCRDPWCASVQGVVAKAEGRS